MCVSTQKITHWGQDFVANCDANFLTLKVETQLTKMFFLSVLSICMSLKCSWAMASLWSFSEWTSSVQPPHLWWPRRDLQCPVCCLQSLLKPSDLQLGLIRPVYCGYGFQKKHLTNSDKESKNAVMYWIWYGGATGAKVRFSSSLSLSSSFRIV